MPPKKKIIKKEQKAKMVEEFSEKFRNSASVILTDFTGLTANEMMDMRKKIKEQRLQYKVLKNTIIKRIFDKLGWEQMKEFVKGPTGICFGDDPVSASKLLTKIASDTGKLKIKGGIIEGKVYDARAINELSRLPSRDELIAKVVAGIASPLSGLIFTLRGVLQNFVLVLNQIKEKKEKEG